MGVEPKSVEDADYLENEWETRNVVNFYRQGLAGSFKQLAVSCIK